MVKYIDKKGRRYEGGGGENRKGRVGLCRRGRRERICQRLSCLLANLFTFCWLVAPTATAAAVQSGSQIRISLVRPVQAERGGDVCSQEFLHARIWLLGKVYVVIKQKEGSCSIYSVFSNHRSYLSSYFICVASL